MKPLFRIFRYLRYFPWQLSLIVLLFNLGSYVMIVPFVELLSTQATFRL